MRELTKIEGTPAPLGGQFCIDGISGVTQSAQGWGSMSAAGWPWSPKGVSQVWETSIKPYGAHVILADSLVNEAAFDSLQVASQDSAADQSLCRAIFDYGLEQGLTEDERALIANTFTDVSKTPGGTS